jgi:hypothetical protein
MDFLTTPTKINNRNTVSIVIGRARYNNPSRQLRANVNVPIIDGNLPNDGNLQLINHLCNERLAAEHHEVEEEPELLDNDDANVEAEEEEENVEQQRE